MKKSDVRIGGVYQAKVSGKLARVRLDAVSVHGGWVGTNLETNHQVTIRTAGRLRKPLGIAPPTSVMDLHTQWQALKASNPGTILLFQMGDFFKAYGDDSTVCSDVLGLAVVSQVDDTETSMTGFPYADMEANLAKLGAAGFRVAICEHVQPGKDLLDTVRHKEEITEGLVQEMEKIVTQVGASRGKPVETIVS